MTSKSVQKRINIQQGKTRMTIQQEIIIWHKYPEEKPPYFWAARLLVAIQLNGSYITTYACEWNKDYFVLPFVSTLDKVIAWAEMPAGWQE